jgi:selenide,water dikinase
VETVDIITPVVNAPFTFGAISAANSLSDIYAMGGRPTTALAIIGSSSCDDMSIVKEIMRGAIEVLEKSGTALMGGHSFEDAELKFGLSVTGLIDKEKMLRARGARAGDIVILTKPIGTGVLSTALKGRKIDSDMPITW